MPMLPDAAFVVRGGLNLIELLEAGSGVTVDGMGNMYGLSVNSAADKTIIELSTSIPNRQLGVTTVGAVRAAGGEVKPDPNRHNPFHCLVNGLSAIVMHGLFNPSIVNPSRVR